MSNPLGCFFRRSLIHWYNCYVNKHFVSCCFCRQNNPLFECGRVCCWSWNIIIKLCWSTNTLHGSRTFLSLDISQLVKFAGSDNSQFVDFQGRTFLSYLFCRVGQFSVRTFVSWLIFRAGRQSDIWRIYCYRSFFNVDYTNQLHKCYKTTL